jgi:hypothetical protein
MAKKVSITRELIRATNISRRRRSESEQAYFNRIVLEVGGLSANARASLSPEAQTWYAGAVEAINQGEMIPSPMVAHHHIAKDGLDDIDEDGADNNNRSEPPTDRRDEREDIPDLAADNRQDASTVTKPLSASDRTRRIILENLGRVEKKTLRELVANAGIAVTNSSFDTIIQVPNGMLTVVKARAREHALKDASTRILLQEGFDYPEFRDELSAIAHEARLHPDQVWCCVGTGTLARSMQLAWPKADFKVVRTGMKPVLGDGMELYEAVPTKNLV